MTKSKQTILLAKKLLDLSYLISEKTIATTASAAATATRMFIATTAQSRNILNHVSNMNSKEKFKNSIKISEIIKTSFRLAKNKRKKLNHPVIKIEKNYLSSMREY